MMNILQIIAALIAVSIPTIATAGGIDITVHVVGIEKQKGEVFAGLYDASTWRNDHFLSAAHVVVDGPETTLHLVAPSPGKYAIKMFHDLDGTGKLARNFLGIPTEPYAFSNNVKGRTGLPEFGAAAFDVGVDGAKLEVHMP
ncbi:DUF2141 domain-containing protein [Burkholderia sp. BCC1972]|uniref:DUF2141 domain-containing protein n=1 Tax=Burkholderia sp. BCC1972 TaxID=2817438 RepID=UPI002ABDA1F1|nr:DUF2141 domain-containing protein [Burkholderia sp. BCC1972]